MVQFCELLSESSTCSSDRYCLFCNVAVCWRGYVISVDENPNFYDSDVQHHESRHRVGVKSRTPKIESTESAT